jgi:glyoxylase-like metal-dependent hydrolase (beta-lactamase superfamily II)
MKNFALIAASALISTGSFAAQGENMKNTSIFVYESGPEGFNTKTIFVDNGQEVVAFDAQFTPALAEAALKFLKTKTKNPVTHLVLTHPNPDKFNGASVFKKAGAKIVASKRTADNIEGTHAYKKYFFVEMAKMFKADEYPTPVAVDETFDKSLRLKLANGDTIDLVETGIAGVSTNQSVAFVPDANALIVGDLVHDKAHAWLEGGIVKGHATPSIASWIKNLELLKKDFGDDVKVFGGRGEAEMASVALDRQIAYLEKADEIVTSYVKKLGAKAKEELTGARAGEHYAALTKEFEKAFPDYRLAYMIQYGVYGLANSKLAE